MTIEDLGVLELSLSVDQLEMFNAVKGLSLSDFNQVIQWFGTAANKYAENLAKDVPIESCFTSLKEEGVISPIQPIINPEKNDSK